MTRYLTFQFCVSIDFSQSFIQHAYIELHMPPNEMSKENQNADAKFKIDQHHLHIWPRHSFMLIGLPNQVCDHINLDPALSYGKELTLRPEPA